MSTCSRCGAADCKSYIRAQKGFEPSALLILPCRDRELANLRSLLRSVTGKLENALEHLSDAESSVSVAKAEGAISAVLEVLS